MCKRINNTTEPSNKVESIPGEIDSILYKKQKMVIDFSFEGSFVSCSVGDFDNYLYSNEDFIQKFRELATDVQKLSQKPIYTLMSDKGFRHCHKVDDEKKALRIIKAIFDELDMDESAFEQIVGGESIYQIGLESAIRYFGTYKGNIFKIFFIDYFHDFEYDQRRNSRNKKYCKFCAMKTELITADV